MSSSWENVSSRYDKLMGEKGSYYHEKVILPSLLKRLNKTKITSVLDLGCGEGVLARHLPKGISYLGVDISLSLIKVAKQKAKGNGYTFLTHDLTQDLILEKKDFSHAAIILALQNIADAKQVFKTAHDHLKVGGMFLIVLNHPCFRIPRQSSWGIDEISKIQYRRIDRYLSDLEVPIDMYPEKTLSYHHPLSYYINLLSKAGFWIEEIEELISDKESIGKNKKMENRARKEFPLFLTIQAIKRDR